jgi:HEAT repeat protein
MRTFILTIGLWSAVVGCSEPDSAQTKPKTDISAVDDRSTNHLVSQPVLSTSDQPHARGNSRHPQFTESPALPTTEDHEERKYAGVPLSVWQVRIKDLDPKGSEALDAVEGLLGLVQDRELLWFTRRQAALKLAAIGPPARRSVSVLIDLLKNEGDKNEVTRLWTAKALAAFGPESREAASFLAHLLRDRSQPYIQRQATIETLAMIGAAHPAAIPALIDVLENRAGVARKADKAHQQHEVTLLREMAADGLAVVGASAVFAVPALIRATRDENESLRRKASSALGAMGSRGEIAIPALVERLVLDESAAVRDTAADSLAAIGLDSVAVLKRFLNDRDPEVSWRAAQSLGKIGRVASSAVELLGDKLNDENPLVRLSVCEAIWKITFEPKPIIPMLVGELTNPDRNLRMRAYQLLIGMGSKSRMAIEPLKKLLDDKRGYVKSVAAKALEKLEAFE